MKATRILWQTCAPSAIGNRFSVLADEREYRIVNLMLEAFEELLSDGLEWPIEIRELSYGVAVILDNRMPAAWCAEAQTMAEGVERKRCD